MLERSNGARLRAQRVQARIAVERDRDRRHTRRTDRDHLQIAAVHRNKDLVEAASVSASVVRNRGLAEAVVAEAATVDRNKDLAEAANAHNHSHSLCRIRSFHSLAVCTPGGTRRVRR